MWFCGMTVDAKSSARSETEQKTDLYIYKRKYVDFYFLFTKAFCYVKNLIVFKRTR